jgi:hypothetical protein
MRRRLNRGLPVALVAALCSTALYVNISGNTVFKPTTSVSAPPLIPDSPPPPPPPSFALSDAGALLRPGNAAVPVANDIQGYVDGVTIEGTAAVINGWAVDATARKPASLIVVMVNGRSAAGSVPAMSRPDVTAALRIPSAEMSGYAVRVTIAPDASPKSTRVRVFALRADGAAHELVYPANYPFGRD